MGRLCCFAPAATVSFKQDAAQDGVPAPPALAESESLPEVLQLLPEGGADGDPAAKRAAEASTAAAKVR